MVQVAAHSRAWLDTVAQGMDGVKKAGIEKLGWCRFPERVTDVAIPRRNK